MEEDQTGLPVYITTILTHDRDSANNAGVSYTMVDGDRSLFSVDSSSGVVQLQRTLDREVQDQYTIIIRATDTGKYCNFCVQTIVIRHKCIYIFILWLMPLLVYVSYLRSSKMGLRQVQQCLFYLYPHVDV